MALIEHKCYTAKCDFCGIEFKTEIYGIDQYYFLSKTELEDFFFDKDWGIYNEKYICKKCKE